MILKNLFRRKGRTFLTLVGIAIGVAAIVALGAVARGMRAGFAAMTRGSQADLVLTQADALSALLSSIDQQVASDLRGWREVAAVDGVLFGNTITENGSYLFFFGHDPEGFAINHFRVVDGQPLDEAHDVRGKALILGRRAADNLRRRVGDTFHVSGTAFRVVGIYETGDGFQDSGDVISLEDAQTITLQPRRVSMLYVKLRDPSDQAQFKTRVERQFPHLSSSTTTGFAEQEQMLEILEIGASAIAGLAILIGGVVIGLREAQSLTGKPRQVMYYAIQPHDPGEAERVKAKLEAAFPDVDVSLTSEIAQSMRDFQVLEEMVTQISLLAFFIGGLGMLNTMLMSVLERTREIGVLRALGWRKRQVLGMILRESLVLGAVGGICGILLGLGLGGLTTLAQGIWGSIEPAYTPHIFVQAVVVALVAGVLGGLYPAWRATRMRPVEALRYE
ncbi:MAG: ABC transporter permease [Chloroflexota bacterium]